MLSAEGSLKGVWTNTFDLFRKIVVLKEGNP